MKHFFKYGYSSILLGYGHYGKFLDIKENKLIKVTLISENHNELNTLSYIREIKNFEQYYCIPDDISFKINPGTAFYEYVKKLSENIVISIFKKNKTLHCNYIENAGNYELLDTINDIFDSDFSFWTCYDDIYLFVKEILTGIHFLHIHKICHLDIKPENIIVNKVNFTFKLIDFGFSSIEPFDNFISNMKGTPGYFPSHNYNYTITEFFPRIYANDIKNVNGKIPIAENRNLVYKVDSYCFGRVLFCLVKSFQKFKNESCCFFWNIEENKKKKKIYKICNDLLINDVNKRITIQECLYSYFYTSDDFISII